jgi:(p)ppGpp synthase/HD superfamily hydrolase
MKLPEAYDFAARLHVGQRRKGAAAEPYVNHLTDVAARVARSPAADETLILAAILHDVIEDTAGTTADIADRFGPEVAALVLEVTDDKALPKAERKRLQVAMVGTKSEGARRIKLADKASNLTALADSPPAGWDAARRADYVAWAERVAAGCRGIDPVLEAGFDAAAARARQALGMAA